jgi:serine/threonine protein kinase
MEDDFFAGHFKLNVHIQENRSRQTSLISDPRQGIRNKPKVTVWMREDSLADNVYLEKTNAGEMRVVKQVRRDPEKLKRILSELRALGRLSKENGLFIQFFGWFESANYIHFAMEYCPLGDISHCFKDPLSEVATRSIGRQVIEGLTKLHEIKITHRDIKPKNILVQQTNPIWVKISDFGFSKHVIDGQSELLTRAGTDGYIAPEVYGLYEPDEDSSAYTSAVDIWSLGCLLHYILTKKTPFPDLGALKTYCSDEGRVFPEEALVEHHVGASGSRFIKRLLILSPKDRPELASINIMRQWKITGVSAVDESTSFHPEDPNKGIVNVNQEDNMVSINIEGVDSTVSSRQGSIGLSHS